MTQAIGEIAHKLIGDVAMKLQVLVHPTVEKGKVCLDKWLKQTQLRH